MRLTLKLLTIVIVNIMLSLMVCLADKNASSLQEKAQECLENNLHLRPQQDEIVSCNCSTLKNTACCEEDVSKPCLSCRITANETGAIRTIISIELHIESGNFCCERRHKTSVKFIIQLNKNITVELSKCMPSDKECKDGMIFVFSNVTRLPKRWRCCRPIRSCRFIPVVCPCKSEDAKEDQNEDQNEGQNEDQNEDQYEIAQTCMSPASIFSTSEVSIITIDIGLYRQSHQMKCTCTIRASSKDNKCTAAVPKSCFGDVTTGQAEHICFDCKCELRTNETNGITCNETETPNSATETPTTSSISGIPSVYSESSIDTKLQTTLPTMASDEPTTSNTAESSYEKTTEKSDLSSVSMSSASDNPTVSTEYSEYDQSFWFSSAGVVVGSVLGIAVAFVIAVVLIMITYLRHKRKENLPTETQLNVYQIDPNGNQQTSPSVYSLAQRVSASDDSTQPQAMNIYSASPSQMPSNNVYETIAVDNELYGCESNQNSSYSAVQFVDEYDGTGKNSQQEPQSVYSLVQPVSTSNDSIEPQTMNILHSTSASQMPSNDNNETVLVDNDLYGCS